MHGGGIVGGGIGGMGSQSLTEVGAFPPIDLLSLPGCLAAWLSGCLAAWLPGCLAGWTCAALRVFAWPSPSAQFNLKSPARAPPTPPLLQWLGWRRRVAAPRMLGGHFRNAADHRDFAAIGTAAGVATAFAAPIGVWWAGLAAGSGWLMAAWQAVPPARKLPHTPPLGPA